MTPGFLFDLDGVLADTEGQYSLFWAEINRLHPTGEQHLERVIKGNTLKGIFNAFFPDPAVRKDIVERLKVFEHDMPYVLFDGALRLVGQIKESAAPVAVVTSSSRRKIDRLFQQQPVLGSLVDHVVVDTDVTRGKPAPDPYIAGARALGREPRNCIVFEDSLTGLRAGMDAGAFVVGIASGIPLSVIKTHCHMAAEKIADIDIDKLCGAFARFHDKTSAQ